MATIKRPNELDEAAKRLNAARDSVKNMTYGNFKSGDLYQGLQRDYQQQGQRAMKDTLGQVAARTGGMASSYATTAANQSYNNYMKALEDAARSMYNEEYSRAQNQYNMAQQDYNNAYSQYRDSVADQRYADELAYQKSRDSIADQRYADELAYQKSRDSIADQRYADEQKENKRQSYLDSIIESAATGIAPAFDSRRANEFGITRAEFDNAVNIGLSQYKNSAGYLSNQAATDERLKQIFGAEGFDWDAYDWNGEAEGLGSAADYFKNAGSAYGADYWEQYSKDAQQGYADADTEAAQEEVMQILKAGGEPPIDLLIDAGWLEEITPTTEGETPNYDSDNNGIPDGLSGLAATMWQNNIDAENEATALENEAKAEEDKIAAVNDIEARIANGENLNTIKNNYGIGDDGNPKTVDKTWEEVTGMSEAEWQQRFNDNQTKNYTYPKTAEGANNIITNLTNSASLSLSDEDQKNFDYIYGDGAYDAVQQFKESIGQVQATPGDEKLIEEWYDNEIDRLLAKVPSITGAQLDALLSKINPEATKVYYDPDYFRQ